LPNDQPIPTSYGPRFFPALRRRGFCAKTQTVSPSEATFEAPDEDAVLLGFGKKTVAAVVVVVVFVLLLRRARRRRA